MAFLVFLFIFIICILSVFNFILFQKVCKILNNIFVVIKE